MTDAEALVFVVDDDASLRASLQDLLESVGLRVAACASAQEFLRCPPPEGPSCLVLDVRLPGLSGLELAASIRPVGALNSDHLHHWAWGHSHVGSGHEIGRAHV